MRLATDKDGTDMCRLGILLLDHYKNLGVVSKSGDEMERSEKIYDEAPLFRVCLDPEV